MAEIFVDVDGVLADFSGAANIIHRRPGAEVPEWNWYRAWGMTDKEFWKPITEHQDFYALVRPTRWLHDLLKIMECLQHEGDVILATSNPPVPSLAASKVRWINRHIGTRYPIMMGPRKDLLAQSNRILIDDYEKNLDQWVDKGGMAVRVNQPWNHGRYRLDRRMDDIADNLLTLGVL
jgi:hypothetical protein